MTPSSRTEYRRRFAEDLLPRIVEAASTEGFAPDEAHGPGWNWVRAHAGGVRAAIHLNEMTGRHTRGGIDLSAVGAIYIDAVARFVGPPRGPARTQPPPRPAYRLGCWGSARHLRFG